MEQGFFAREAQEVAPGLLGCVIEHETAQGLVAVVLTEVEAYAGESDPASHAFRGRTSRNAVMYGPPGRAYVYFTYGMHYCVNLVCRPEGEASAVLLRAGRVTDGVPLARARRYGSPAGPGQPAGFAPAPAGPGQPAGFAPAPAGSARPATIGGRGPGAGGPPRQRRARHDIDLARGPARLCEALGIDRAYDGTDVCAPGGALRVLMPPVPVPADRVGCGPRVGVSRAADVPWRFWIAGDEAVSPYRRYAPRVRGKTGRQRAEERQRAGPNPVTGRGGEGGTMRA